MHTNVTNFAWRVGHWRRKSSNYSNFSNCSPGDGLLLEPIRRMVPFARFELGVPILHEDVIELADLGRHQKVSSWGPSSLDVGTCGGKIRKNALKLKNPNPTSLMLKPVSSATCRSHLESSKNEQQKRSENNNKGEEETRSCEFLFFQTNQFSSKKSGNKWHLDQFLLGFPLVVHEQSLQQLQQHIEVHATVAHILKMAEADAVIF